MSRPSPCPSPCLPHPRSFTLVHSPCWRTSWSVALFVPLLGFMGYIPGALAQGSQLRPPTQMQPSGQLQPAGQLQAPTQWQPPAALQPPSPQQGSTLQAPARPSQAASAALANNLVQPTSVSTLSRFRTLKVDGRAVDIGALPDSTVLRGNSGKTITVAQLKQLEARINGASSAPVLVAKQGQTIRTLAAAPAGTRIVLPGGKVARAEDMVKLQSIYAKLSEPRVIKPIPQSMPNATAQAVVGQGTTLADAMKRPAGDVIQIGSRKYTAEQLRQIDALLKASPRDPRGLVERSRSATPPGRTGAPVSIATGPRVKLQPGTSIQDMLAKPDGTVLESPNGKVISVAQLKQYMAHERLTVAQLQARATQRTGNRVVEIK